MVLIILARVIMAFISPILLSPFKEESSVSNSNIFFNSNIPIRDLKKITEETNVNELFLNWNTAQKKYNDWVSNKTSPVLPLSSAKTLKFPFELTPPPGFEKVKPVNNLSDLSTESEVSPTIQRLRLCPIIENDVKLQPPPKCGIVKREKRGTFNEEKVSYDRYEGEIKFYQLKKRFGFIALDEDKSDVFLCEDDLVLSGINIKKFKEAVFKRIVIRMNFLIKIYFENAAQKRKAIDIRLISEIN
jgi:hypothetical protein